MQLCVTLSLCIFLLCCTGSLRRLAARLCIPVGNIAALSLLIAAFSGTDFHLAPGLSLHLSSFLLIGTSLFLCRKTHGISLTVLLAFLSGIISWFLLQILPSFAEPALAVILPAVLLSLLLPGSDRLKLLCLSISPFFYGLVASLEEWYLFDTAQLFLGDSQQLNSQMCGVFLFCALHGSAKRNAKKMLVMQKEY